MLIIPIEANLGVNLRFSFVTVILLTAFVISFELMARIGLFHISRKIAAVSAIVGIWSGSSVYWFTQGVINNGFSSFTWLSLVIDITLVVMYPAVLLLSLYDASTGALVGVTAYLLVTYYVVEA